MTRVLVDGGQAGGLGLRKYPVAVLRTRREGEDPT